MPIYEIEDDKLFSFAANHPHFTSTSEVMVDRSMEVVLG